MNPTERQRRMISTYPFKYTYTEPSKYFEPEKVALYVHVPFCLKRCHYCTYVSLINFSDEIIEKYVQAVCEEIKQFPLIPCYPGFNVDALYFGGGTPSVLSSEQIKRILDTCKETFHFLDDVEICMEFDPTNVTEEKLQKVKEFGINRVSMGVQSFNDTVLKSANRSHGSEKVYKAVELIKTYGISNFNLDLIYPLMHQDMDIWEHDLNEAIRLEPAAITAHVLEVWPNTRMARLVEDKSYQLPPYEEEIKMTNRAYDILEENGFKRWSNCGYYHPGRTNHYCRFMEYYWRTYPMIGFGVSSKTVLGQRVYTNVSKFDEYINRVMNNKSALDFSVKMTKRQEMLRVVIRGLKACYIDKQYFMDRFGVSLDTVFGKEIEYLVNMGWMNDLPDRIEMTRSGQVYDRDVYSVFYTEDDLRLPQKDEVMVGLSMDVEELKNHHDELNAEK